MSIKQQLGAFQLTESVLPSTTHKLPATGSLSQKYEIPMLEYLNEPTIYENVSKGKDSKEKGGLSEIRLWVNFFFLQSDHNQTAINLMFLV